MESKTMQDYEELTGLLNSTISLKEKYFKIKSLERGLLEYIIFKDNLIIPTSHQLSNAAEFISSYFLIHNIWYQFEYYAELAEYTLLTLEIILKSTSKGLQDIPEFRMYERYFYNLKENLAAV